VGFIPYELSPHKEIPCGVLYYLNHIKMVTIKDYAIRENTLGEKFCALIVQGGIEFMKSKETGRFYITAKTASVPCTFPEEICKTLIGKELPGSVKKKECEPYEFVNQETGETRILDYRYEYSQEGESVDEVVHSDKVQTVFNQ